MGNNPRGSQSRLPRGLMLTVAMMLSIYFTASAAQAAGLQALFGLSPRDTRTQKLGLTVGLGGEEWIFSISSIFNSEYKEDDLVDTPIPHTSYEDLGTRRIGNLLGVDVCKTFEARDNLPAVVLGGGFYFGRTSHIVRSNATGWLWAQDNKSVVLPGVGVGLLFRVQNKYAFGVDLHSLRGPGLSLTIRL